MLETSGSEKRRFKMNVNHKQVLRRSRRNRILAGVCGGLAEFFGISAFWFRLAMLIALIPGGVPGLLIYILLWIMVPSE
jgi:phage shock protein PspC (stress-responsive transcriptional regulator)